MVIFDTSNIQKIVFHEFCDEYYSKLLGWVLGGSFWPYSREYLSQQYLSSTGTLARGKPRYTLARGKHRGAG